MYSVPFSQDFHSNYLAVGIFEPQDTRNVYNVMYYDAETKYFKRKYFWNDADPIYFDDGKDFLEVQDSKVRLPCTNEGLVTKAS